MKLHEKIRNLRENNNYSKEELAKLLGVNEELFDSIENGNVEPDIKIIRLLSNVFNISFDELLDENISINNKITNTLKYEIYEYKSHISDYFTLLLYFTLVAIFFAYFLHCSILIITGNYNRITIMACVCFATLFIASLALLHFPIKIIDKIKSDKDGVLFGELNYKNLIIKNFTKDGIKGTINISLTEIESIKVYKSFLNNGKVIIKLKDKENPIITKDIINPKRLVEVYNNLDKLKDYSFNF